MKRAGRRGLTKATLVQHVASDRRNKASPDVVGAQGKVGYARPELADESGVERHGLVQRTWTYINACGLHELDASADSESQIHLRHAAGHNATRRC